MAKEHEALLKSKGWTLGPRGDGQFAVKDSSGQQIGVGPDEDAAVDAALAYSDPDHEPEESSPVSVDAAEFDEDEEG